LKNHKNNKLLKFVGNGQNNTIKYL